MSTEDLDKSVEQAYLILLDVYHSAKIQNMNNSQILFLLNKTIERQKLAVKQITVTELAMFEQSDLNRSVLRFGDNRVVELQKAKVDKINKLELIEKNLWTLAGNDELGPSDKARVYGHLADVVLKEKDLEDELVRLLN